MEENEGNGNRPLTVSEQKEYEALEGANLKLGEMRRPDSGFLRFATDKQNQSVLHRAMTAAKTPEDILQELKTAFFKSTQEADRFVASLAEARRYGCDLQFNLEWLVAHAAGEGGARLKAVFETISHTTFTSNIQSPDKKRWWQNDRNRNNSTGAKSPLSS